MPEDEIHTFNLVERIDKLVHLKCPKCGKEVLINHDQNSPNYKVLAVERGSYLARHVWNGGIKMKTSEVNQ